jgi:high-affinity nickel permease
LRPFILLLATITNVIIIVYMNEFFVEIAKYEEVEEAKVKRESNNIMTLNDEQLTDGKS